MANNRNNYTKTVREDLPHNLQAEKAVIGSALLNAEAMINVLSMLSKEDFFDIKNQIIYQAMLNIQLKNTPVDVLTVSEELSNMNELSAIGGPEYLKDCCDSMVAFSALDFYINIVLNQSVLRKLLNTIRDIDEDYHHQEIEDVNDFIANSERRIKEATEKRRVSTFKTSGEVAKVVETTINSPKEIGADNVPYLTTGYRELNRLTQGFNKTELIIIAARPGLGKTSLALNIGYRVATKTRKPVAFFSLEMSSEELVTRLIGCESNVPLENLANGNISTDQRIQISRAVNKLAKAPIYIDDTPGGRLMDIIAKCRKLQSKEPDLGLIIIDYIGLISGVSMNKNDNRQEEVRKISLALKSLTMELKVPIIAVSQLSRNTEQRGENKRPMLSDLRDSGSIEQDADKVLLLFREDYYKNQIDPNGEKKGGKLKDNEKKELSYAQKKIELAQSMPNSASYVEINIAKNRNGRVGTAGLFFYKGVCRFDEPPAEFQEKMDELNAKMKSDNYAL